MKLHRMYHIIVNGIVYAVDSNQQRIIKMLEEVRRTEPTAYVQTYYA